MTRTGYGVIHVKALLDVDDDLFFSMNHAPAVVANWVEDFNTGRPHSAIGYMTPAAYAAALNPQRAPAPPGKLRGDARCYRRAHAQFSAGFQ